MDKKLQQDSRCGKGPLRLMLLAIIAFAFFLIVPLAINLLFQTEAPFDLFKAQYDASDLLAYAGITLTGTGTLAIGIATLYNSRQTLKIQSEMQKESNRLQKSMNILSERNIKRPYFVIENIRFESIDIDANKNGIYLLKCHDDKPNKNAVAILRNIGDGPAVKINLHPDSAFGIATGKNRENRVCEQGDTIEFRLPLTPEKYSHSSFQSEFAIVYHNIINSRFVQTIEIMAEENIEHHQEHYDNGAQIIPVQVDEQYGFNVLLGPLGPQHEEMADLTKTHA